MAARLAPATGLALGRALAAEGRSAEALEPLLRSVEADEAHADEAARKTLLDLFEILGSDHDATREARQRLGRLLYR